MSKRRVMSTAERRDRDLDKRRTAAYNAVEELDSGWKWYARALEEDLERANKKLAKLGVDPDAYEATIIDEYLALLQEANKAAQKMWSGEGRPTASDTSLISYVMAMSGVVRFLASELGIESRTEGHVTEGWPDAEGGRGIESVPA
jgi:hypothetical protein